jgi:hypothetical protein
MVAIKYRGTTKAATSGMIETMNSIINHSLFLVTKMYS